MTPAFKSAVLGVGFTGFRATGLHRLLARATRGLGVILMFHSVTTKNPTSLPFGPNRGLEISPEYLDAVLGRLTSLGYQFIGIDDVPGRLNAEKSDAPFAALTFDDGYRDTRDCALPVLEKHKAPCTLYIAPGIAERSARLWWMEIEAAAGFLDVLDLDVGGVHLRAPMRDAQEKAAALTRLYWRLRALPDAALLAAVDALLVSAGLDPQAVVEAHFLSWHEIAGVASHPLVTIGAHTISHPRLSKLSSAEARNEMATSRDAIEARLGAPVRHFAYPFGDSTSAGVREFALARELGFATAVTTRPGTLFPEHSEHLPALPRLSVNGNWQDVGAFEVLLSGAPFALWNRGRRLNVA